MAKKNTISATASAVLPEIHLELDTVQARMTRAATDHDVISYGMIDGLEKVVICGNKEVAATMQNVVLTAHVALQYRRLHTAMVRRQGLAIQCVTLASRGIIDANDVDMLQNCKRASLEVLKRAAAVKGK